MLNRNEYTMRHRLDFGGLSDWFINSKSAFAINEVCGENGVDQRRFSETCLTCTTCQTPFLTQLGRNTNTNDVELETSFEQLPFNLVCD